MTKTRRFIGLLTDRWSQGKFVCVGLDPRIERIPNYPGPMSLSDSAESLFCFNEAIVLATRDLVCAYKLNRAFYERYGAAGMEALEGTVSRIREVAPGVPIIYDAKYGDTPDTNEMYAEYAFDVLKADAVTVNPYMGLEALEPFTRRIDKGVFILCRTSNPGAETVQSQLVADKYAVGHAPLSEFIASDVAQLSRRTAPNLGLVMGATNPSDIVRVRTFVGNEIPFLIPGVGKQGGDLEASVRGGARQGRGIIVNASRSIIHASSGDDFAEAARQETLALDQRIRETLLG